METRQASSGMGEYNVEWVSFSVLLLACDTCAFSEGEGEQGRRIDSSGLRWNKASLIGWLANVDPFFLYARASVASS